jgi:hypothetical protein
MSAETEKPNYICMQVVDKLRRSLNYLHHSWGIDTPRDYMQANLDARAIIIRLCNQIIDEAELELMVNNRVQIGKI